MATMADPLFHRRRVRPPRVLPHGAAREGRQPRATNQRRHQLFRRTNSDLDREAGVCVRRRSHLFRNSLVDLLIDGAGFDRLRGAGHIFLGSNRAPARRPKLQSREVSGGFPLRNGSRTRQRGTDLYLWRRTARERAVTSSLFESRRKLQGTLPVSVLYRVFLPILLKRG